MSKEVIDFNDVYHILAAFGSSNPLLSVARQCISILREKEAPPMAYQLCLTALLRHNKEFSDPEYTLLLARLSRSAVEFTRNQVLTIVIEAGHVLSAEVLEDEVLSRLFTTEEVWQLLTNYYGKCSRHAQDQSKVEQSVARFTQRLPSDELSRARLNRIVRSAKVETQ